MSAKLKGANMGIASSSPSYKLAMEIFAEKGDELSEKFSSFCDSFQWVITNREALRKKYGGKFIAVRNEKIFAHDADLGKLLKKVKAKYKDSQYVVIDFIERQPVINLL